VRGEGGRIKFNAMIEQNHRGLNRRVKTNISQIERMTQPMFHLGLKFQHKPFLKEECQKNYITSRVILSASNASLPLYGTEKNTYIVSRISVLLVFFYLKSNLKE
jgi:hypothetical protein